MEVSEQNVKIGIRQLQVLRIQLNLDDYHYIWKLIIVLH